MQTGWPDDWQLGIGWELDENSCDWCPKGSGRCEKHHQSPIDLERNLAIEGDPMYQECIDVHWMKYEDSACSWNDLTTKDAFSIERHALKVTQPLEYGEGGDEGIRLDCTIGGEDGRRFGRIDFSRGFSYWWFLSHIDFKVPSEHTQDGKRYSAEVQMAHFFSLSGEDAGVNNEMGTVSMFLQAYEDSPPYPHLDRLICEWRKAEDKTRKECGLPAVGSYPGCYNTARGHTPFPSEAPVAPTSAPIAPTIAPLSTPPTSAPTKASAQSTRPTNGSTSKPTTKATPAPTGAVRKLSTSVKDVITDNSKRRHDDKQRIVLEAENFRPPDKSDEEWTEWVEAISAHDRGEASEEQRKLLEGDYLLFHNYQFLIDVRTEYYFRYAGTSTVPPCYGRFVPNSRENTNHWRVLKDPIRVHPRQIAEMERLLRERIAPTDANSRACENDTAGKVDSDGHISVARPVMEYDLRHYASFCECDDWQSKWPEDRAWCSLNEGDKRTRFFDQPYNYINEDEESF